MRELRRLRSSEPRVRFAWVARAIGAALAGYVRLLVVTCRFRGEIPRNQAVLAFWHEANIAGLAAALRWRGEMPHASFSTRGFRGVAVTRLLEGLGVLTLPLPEESDRAAARALSLALARMAAEGYSLPVTPDGPFGPARVAKPGALIMARESGLPLQPVALSARPAIRLVARWDRHILPMPFCRLRVDEGEAIRVGPREPLRPLLARLQTSLDDVYARSTSGTPPVRR